MLNLVLRQHGKAALRVLPEVFLEVRRVVAVFDAVPHTQFDRQRVGLCGFWHHRRRGGFGGLRQIISGRVDSANDHLRVLPLVIGHLCGHVDEEGVDVLVGVAVKLVQPSLGVGAVFVALPVLRQFTDTSRIRQQTMPAFALRPCQTAERRDIAEHRPRGFLQLGNLAAGIEHGDGDLGLLIQPGDEFVQPDQVAFQQIHACCTL